MSATTPDRLPEIDGVEQLDIPILGSKPFTKKYHRDEADALVERVCGLPDRTKHFIAPRAGWPKCIYRRPDRKPKR